MPPVDRNQPERCTSSESRVSLMEFMREFPDDATCLEWLWRERWSEDGEHADCPKCNQRRRFKRYTTAQRRQSWTCTGCGHHVHPTAGTIFHKSSTSLHLWFYAFYLMTSTRCGISAKQVEREIGVNYKTAWRMLNRIRNELMCDEDGPLSGEVELDETWVGGKPRASDAVRSHRDAAAFGKRKSIVFGMVQRKGRVKATVITDSSRQTLRAAVGDHVLPESMVFTDEWPAYTLIGREFRGHHRIAHKQRVYVDGNVHTNTIEGFFGLMKNGIRGTYHAVSRTWLQSYCDEFAWRYNHRDDDQAQFRSLLLAAARR